MTTNKYNIGDTVYFTDKNGVFKDQIRAIWATETAEGYLYSFQPNFLGPKAVNDSWYHETIIFPTKEALIASIII